MEPFTGCKEELDVAQDWVNQYKPSVFTLLLVI